MSVLTYTGSLLVSASFTRPADTTAYAIKDVVSNSTSAPSLITFAGAGRVSGSTGTIVRARLVTSQKGNVAAYRLHLFHTAPTPINDNSPFLFLDANKAKTIGAIDFPVASTEDATNSTAAFTSRPSADGASTPPNLWFKLPSGITALLGVLETLTVFTPDSAQTYFIELGIASN
jgi:hypothetical protein